MAAILDIAFPNKQSWTLYWHDPSDEQWGIDSYKMISTYTSFLPFWGTIKEMNQNISLDGMMFFMRDPHKPLWESNANIRGGSYCIKVSRRLALDTYQRYVTAAIAGNLAGDAANTIVGVSMSPKKGFCIIKIWNALARLYNRPSDIQLLNEELKSEDVLYRPHVSQKM